MAQLGRVFLVVGKEDILHVSQLVGQVEGGEVQRQRHFDLHHPQAACLQGPSWGPSEIGEAENLWLDGTS